MMFNFCLAERTTIKEKSDQQPPPLLRKRQQHIFFINWGNHCKMYIRETEYMSKQVSKCVCMYLCMWCGCVCQSTNVCIWCVGVYVKAQVCVCGVYAKAQVCVCGGVWVCNVKVQVCVCGVSTASLLKSREELYKKRSAFIKIQTNALSCIVYQLQKSPSNNHCPT